jgi:hypothetical protein
MTEYCFLNYIYPRTFKEHDACRTLCFFYKQTIDDPICWVEYGKNWRGDHTAGIESELRNAECCQSDMQYSLVHELGSYLAHGPAAFSFDRVANLADGDTCLLIHRRILQNLPWPIL